MRGSVAHLPPARRRAHTRAHRDHRTGTAAARLEHEVQVLEERLLGEAAERLEDRAAHAESLVSVGQPVPPRAPVGGPLDQPERGQPRVQRQSKGRDRHLGRSQLRAQHRAEAVREQRVPVDEEQERAARRRRAGVAAGRPPRRRVDHLRVERRGS